MAAIQTYTWDFVDRPRAQAVQGSALTLQLNAYASGTLAATPTATITVRTPGGGALPAPVTAAAVTVGGSGNMSYILAAGNTAQLGSNYLANWQVTIGTVVFPVVQLFDVVRYPFRNVVQLADLARYHFDIASSFGAESNAQVYIEEAYIDVWHVLDAKGRRPHLILSAEDFRRPIEHLALARYFRARLKSPDDRWAKLAEHHQSEYERWFATANFVYDTDDSGTVDGTSVTGAQSGEEGRTNGFGWRI